MIRSPEEVLNEVRKERDDLAVEWAEWCQAQGVDELTARVELLEATVAVLLHRQAEAFSLEARTHPILQDPDRAWTPLQDEQYSVLDNERAALAYALDRRANGVPFSKQMEDGG